MLLCLVQMNRQGLADWKSFVEVSVLLLPPPKRVKVCNVFDKFTELRLYSLELNFAFGFTIFLIEVKWSPSTICVHHIHRLCVEFFHPSSTAIR